MEPTKRNLILIAIAPIAIALFCFILLISLRSYLQSIDDQSAAQQIAAGLPEIRVYGAMYITILVRFCYMVGGIYLIACIINLYKYFKNPNKTPIILPKILFLAGITLLILPDLFRKIMFFVTSN